MMTIARVKSMNFTEVFLEKGNNDDLLPLEIQCNDIIHLGRLGYVFWDICLFVFLSRHNIYNYKFVLKYCWCPVMATWMNKKFKTSTEYWKLNNT